MNISKQLSLRIAAVAAAALFAGTSVFADSRPSDETKWRGGDRSDIRRERERESRIGDNRQPYYAEGRISEVKRHGSGHRVWVSGSRYPFYVPPAYYDRDRFRPGVTIRIGGIFNVGGYYDYYDDRHGDRYDDRYDRRRSRELRGYVDRVDRRRDVFTMRDERTGRFVTVVMRDRDERVRRGDFVEVDGRWSRSGVFEAYDVDRLGRYRR